MAGATKEEWSAFHASAALFMEKKTEKGLFKDLQMPKSPDTAMAGQPDLDAEIRAYELLI